MDITTIPIIMTGFLGLVGFGVLGYLYVGAGGRRQADIRDMMATPSSARGADPSKQVRRLSSGADLEVEDIKRMSGTAVAKKQRTDDISTKLFRAGFFTARDRRNFFIGQVAAFIVAMAVIPMGMQALLHKPALTAVGFVLGALIGYAMPISWVEKQIRKREEELMYYLPLVIEQVSIGVSSSLDIGPCIANIVHMANERDSHNPITEMFVHVEKLMRSGLNLEESLIEVGTASGMVETKHAFMFLSQCAKHGGEITKQLQELADAVMTARQVQVEGKITQLPVKATGPLIMVFAGFFGLLIAGLLVRLASAFGDV